MAEKGSTETLSVFSMLRKECIDQGDDIENSDTDIMFKISKTAKEV